MFEPFLFHHKSIAFLLFSWPVAFSLHFGWGGLLPWSYCLAAFQSDDDHSLIVDRFPSAFSLLLSKLEQQLTANYPQLRPMFVLRVCIPNWFLIIPQSRSEFSSFPTGLSRSVLSLTHSNSPIGVAVLLDCVSFLPQHLDYSVSDEEGGIVYSC